MTNQLSLGKEDLAPLEDKGDGTMQVTEDLAYMRLSIVNVVFYGKPSDPGGWVLIDTALPTSRQTILEAAEQRFGKGARPAAIIMTHAHFDHAGSLEALSREWDVPVYAHPLELPYLDGSTSYPPADPLVGGGLMALLSPLFPRSPVNVSERLHALPADGTVPGMPGWTWIHTPGHTPGHVSLWRAEDRSLVAGDAIISTGQESVYEVLTQEPEMHGPPQYFTPDWSAAGQSVRALAALAPERVISGHGKPVRGAGMRARLDRLAQDFEAIAVPRNRRQGGEVGPDETVE